MTRLPLRQISFQEHNHEMYCECRLCEHRTYARFVLRGLMSYNDIDLGEDPWDHGVKTPRTSSGT